METKMRSFLLVLALFIPLASNAAITAEQLKAVAEPLLKSGYGQYLLEILK